MYRTSAAIENIIGDLAELPEVSRISLSRTTGKRPVSALRVRVGGGGERPGVLLVGGIHARELNNPDLLVEFVLKLLDHQDRDWDIGRMTWAQSRIRLILSSLDIFVLPNANPDGRERVLGGDRLWRKNTRFVQYRPYPEDSCWGVDLNRNFNLVWGTSTITDDGDYPTTTNQCGETFCGDSAFSEIETRNVRTLLNDHPIKCMADLHSYGETVLHPWGHAPSQSTDSSQRFDRVDTSHWDVLPTDAPKYKEYISPRDLERFQTVGHRVSSAIRDVRSASSSSSRPRPDYVVGSGCDIYYPATGTSSDWAYSRHIADSDQRKVYGFTIETGRPNGWNAVEGFQPLDAEAALVREEVASGLLALLEASICAIDVIGGDSDAAHFAAARSVRDDHLGDTAAGRSWLSLIERNQAELARLALADRALGELATRFLTLGSRALQANAPLDATLHRVLLDLHGRLKKSKPSPSFRQDLAHLEPLLAGALGQQPSKLLDNLKRRPPGKHSPAKRRQTKR